MSETEPKNWMDNRTLVYMWLLLFFPVGLYAVWKGSLFDDQMRWVITGGAVAVVILLYLAGLSILFLRLIFPAAGVYLCWKDPRIADTTTYKFAGAAVVLLLISLYISGGNQLDQNATSGPAPSDDPSCSAPLTKGNCTYFRDDNCNVIGQLCE